MQSETQQKKKKKKKKKTKRKRAVPGQKINVQRKLSRRATSNGTPSRNSVTAGQCIHNEKTQRVGGNDFTDRKKKVQF